MYQLKGSTWVAWQEARFSVKVMYILTVCVLAHPLPLIVSDVRAAEPTSNELYHPPGMWSWDFWFAKKGEVYHAFYLQAPICVGSHKLKQNYMMMIGHATSTNLNEWKNCGPVVCAIPGTWNDGYTATGSVVAHEGHWWMVYTGRNPGADGVGLAVSDNLYQWTKVGDGPIVPLSAESPSETADGVFTGHWKSQKLRWIGIADPYVYPEPIDGKFVMVLNAKVVGDPVATNGCLATLLSLDLKTWQPGPVLAYPQWFDRLETPQLWTHGGRWYLYFGGALDHGIPNNLPQPIKDRGIRGNYVFTSDRWDGPYEPRGEWHMKILGYIAKVLPGPSGKDVLLITVRQQLSRPYLVVYPGAGGLGIENNISEE